MGSLPPHQYENGSLQGQPKPEMRGVVIISVPRSDVEGGGKTVCAAVWRDGQQLHPHQPQPLPQHQLPQQQVVLQAPSNGLGRRRFRRGRSFRKAAIFSFMLIAAIVLGCKAPTLLKQQPQEEEEEDKRVHVYTLYPKYTSGPIQMSQVRRTLLERDFKRLGKTSVTPNNNNNNNNVNVNNSNNTTALIPLRGNVYPDGLYYMALLLGTPSKLYFLDVDTGSDLTWLQCDAPCRSCAPGPHGLYNPRKAKLVDCRLPVCTQIQAGGAYACNGGVNQCDYDVEYADGSSTMGVLLEDTVTLVLTNGTRSRTKAIIGCGYDQQGTLAQSPASTDGVMGLSSSKVALPSQLAEQGIVNNVIGHCLAGGSNGGGYLFFGDELVPSWGMTWTPMMGRPAIESYQALLHSIKYGADTLQVSGKDTSANFGGVMFDSGTSFTYLVPDAYAVVLDAVEKQAKRSGLVRTTSDNTLPYCWHGRSPFQSVMDVNRYFKQITLDFGGNKWFSTSRTLDLDPEGYLIVSAQGNVCLGILDASGASLEVTNIIGDISMRGYLIVYDNVRQQIGWIRRNCHIRPTRTSSQVLTQVASLFN